MSNLDPNASSVSPTNDLIKLNCFVLGSDSSGVFEIKIASTESVSALKKLIKEEKRPEFDTIAADRLELWKVNLSVENEIRPQLQDNDKISRSPMLKLSKFFSGHLDEEHVHVVIKSPHLVSSISPSVDLINLNCFILGDDIKHIFEIQIPSTATVSALKDVIKEKRNPDFDAIAAARLELWQVNLPIDDKIEQALKGYALDRKGYLLPTAQIFEHFNSQRTYLQVIIRPVSCRLNCLVSGDRLSKIFNVEIALAETVDTLKELIKKKPLFDGIDTKRLELWNVDLPIDATLEQTLKSLEVHPKNSLFPVATLLQVFSVFPDKNHLHIIVWCGNEEVLANVERPADAVMNLTRVFQTTLKIASKLPSPSTAAKSSEYMKIQAKQAAIYDGRYACKEPADTNTPPIQLFNPAFAYFSSKAFDTTYAVPNDTLRIVQEFITESAAIHSKEDNRKKALTRLLEELIGHPLIHAETRHTNARPDGVVFSSHGHYQLHLIFHEEKNEIGEGGSDPAVQASFSFLNSSIEHDVEARLWCNCPAFLIARAGPWLAVLGAILTERCVVQRLTDYIWIPVHSALDDDQFLRVGRVLHALKESVALLKNWYDNVFERGEPPFNVSHPVPHSRFFPTPDTYICNGNAVQFKYRRQLETNPSCVTYLAMTVEAEPKDVVVKFVTRYGDEVHKAMADAGLAPKLLYYGPIDIAPDMPSYGRLKMVVMEYVDGSTAFDTQPLPPNFHRDLKKAIEYCHRRGFVFGDLRKPNVMITKDWKVQLIDFDWAGRDGEVMYPVSISRSINWPKGVAALEPIFRQHDLDMLEDYRD